jgi:uncharacterized YigZ family protein
MSEYLIPAEPHRVSISVSNSRFITSAARVDTVDDAKQFLASIREEMPHASHHVYAFRVGHGNSVTEGMSDDGEPSGTSGPPVLAVLRGSGIGDIIIVVTRYFGGTKLGTGGLVRAYSDAARSVLETLKTERKIERQTVGVEMSYSFYQPIRRLIEQHEGMILEEDFAAEVTILALFPLDQIETFTNAVIDLTAGNVSPVILSD